MESLSPRHCPQDRGRRDNRKAIDGIISDRVQYSIERAIADLSTATR